MKIVMALITTMFPHLSHLRTSAAFLSAQTVIIYAVFLIVSSVLTGGDTKLAADLQAAYGDVNAVDMYVGFFVERCTKMSPFGITTIAVGAPYSLRGLLSNPVSSPTYWKPSTFGGEVGFDMVKTATLEKLFCQNIAGKCPLVTFRVPKDIAREARKTLSLVQPEAPKVETKHFSSKDEM